MRLPEYVLVPRLEQMKVHSPHKAHGIEGSRLGFHMFDLTRPVKPFGYILMLIRSFQVLVAHFLVENLGTKE